MKYYLIESKLLLGNEQYKLIFLSRNNNNSEIFMTWTVPIVIIIFSNVCTGIVHTQSVVSLLHLFSGM